MDGGRVNVEGEFVEEEELEDESHGVRVSGSGSTRFPLTLRSASAAKLTVIPGEKASRPAGEVQPASPSSAPGLAGQGLTG